MRILQVSNRVPWPLNEGGTIGIYNYTRAYAELGHEVTLYCLDGLKHNTPVTEAKAELSKYAKVFIHPIDTDVKTEEALSHLLRNESYNVSRFFNTVFEKELIALLKNETFDVVQLEGTFTGPYMKAVRKHHKGLLTLRMHNVEYEIWERLSSNDSNPIKKIYLRILACQLRKYESSLLPLADVVATVTDDDGEKFKQLYRTGNYLTIPAGIDLSCWKFSPSSGYYNWYHIGSMEWHANAEAVAWYLDAIHPLMAAQQPNYRLHLAGKGLDTKAITSADALVVHSNVANAFDFVKQQDICVVPLKSGSGIRLKILEAMAAGKLVVSTTIGAQGIQYINGTHLLIADTPEQFCAVLTRLQKGDIDYATIVQNARKLIEDRYATAALAASQLAYYQSIIK
jgi:glycosyltransferase involved in cell wall biosynthesis